MAIILDLGCGENKYPGSVGLDRLPLKGVDVVCDLEAGIPYEDNSVDLIICNHYLEHVGDIISFMGEAHRVLKPGGRIRIRVPYYTNIDSYSDPTHKHFFTEASFHYFTEGWIYSYYATPKFKIIETTFIYRPWAKFLPFKKYWRSLLLNVVNEIIFELEPVK